MNTCLKLCLVAIGWSLGAVALSGCIVEQGDLDAEAPLEGEVESFDDAEPFDAEPFDAEPFDAEPFDAEPFDAEPFDPGLVDHAELYEEAEPYEEAGLQAVAGLQAAGEPAVADHARASRATDDLEEDVFFPTNLGAGAEETGGDPNNPDPTPWQTTGDDQNPDPTPWRYPWSTQAQASFHPYD